MFRNIFSSLHFFIIYTRVDFREIEIITYFTIEENRPNDLTLVNKKTPLSSTAVCCLATYKNKEQR